MGSIFNKRPATIMLNTILIFTISMMIILFAEQNFAENLENYLLLDDRYQQQIRTELNHSLTIKFLDPENA